MNDSNTLPFEPSQQWTNYGDVNPFPHGGRFIRWDGDMWHVITTTHRDVLPEGFLSDDETHLIEHYWFEPMDVWDNGKPENGFTDAFKRILSSLGEEHLAEYATKVDHWDKSLDYYVVDLVHYVGDSRDHYVSDYWEHLENNGIDVTEYRE